MQLVLLSETHCARDGSQNKMAVCVGTCSLHLDVVTAHYHIQKTKKSKSKREENNQNGRKITPEINQFIPHSATQEKGDKKNTQ